MHINNSQRLPDNQIRADRFWNMTIMDLLKTKKLPIIPNPSRVGLLIIVYKDSFNDRITETSTE